MQPLISVRADERPTRARNIGNVEVFMVEG